MAVATAAGARAAARVVEAGAAATEARAAAAVSPAGQSMGRQHEHEEEIRYARNVVLYPGVEGLRNVVLYPGVERGHMCRVVDKTGNEQPAPSFARGPYPRLGGWPLARPRLPHELSLAVVVHGLHSRRRLQPAGGSPSAQCRDEAGSNRNDLKAFKPVLARGSPKRRQEHPRLLSQTGGDAEQVDPLQSKAQRPVPGQPGECRLAPPSGAAIQATRRQLHAH